MNKRVSLILFLLLALINTEHAQTGQVRNLVFEGAGIRGIAYAGVVGSLEEHGLTKDIERVGGTSSGAIAALLFSLGYSSAEMETIISGTKLHRFNDGRFFFIGGISRTKEKYGWYRGEKFTDWIGKLIEEKTGNSEITFEELQQKGFKDLYITATCLNRQNLIILSHETYPKMKVKDAVRISMSIPLYFQAVFVDREGRTFSKQTGRNNLDVMVDGGITGNFPIQMFDSIENNYTNNIIRIPNYETLGIRIDSDAQIKEDSASGNLAPFKIENFSDYISSFYNMVIENLNRSTLTIDDWKRTVSVSSADISPKIRRLTKDQKKTLINNGRKSIENYFANLK